MSNDNQQGFNNTIETRMALVEKELDTVYGIFQRLETTMERITDLSVSVKEILAVHENRLMERERADVTLFETIEKRKEEYERGIERINEKISEMKDDLRKELTDQFQKLLEAETKTKKEQADKLGEFDKRIDKMEHLKWIMLGAGLAIGLIFGNGDHILKAIEFLAK